MTMLDLIKTLPTNQQRARAGLLIGYGIGIDQLRAMTEQEIAGLRQLGPVTARSIMNALRAYDSRNSPVAAID